MTERVGVVATLTFPLPEEQQAFDRAVNGIGIVAALHNFDSWLRAEGKHGSGTVTTDEARKQLRDALDACGVSRFLDE